MVQIKPFQGGEFNQVQTTDYVPELQRGYEKYNRSVDRAEGFARQNDERLIKMAGQSWEALAELLSKLVLANNAPTALLISGARMLPSKV